MKFGSNGGNAALTFNLPANASDTTLMSYEAIVRINSGALQYQRPIHVGSLDYPSNRWDLEFDNSWGWVFASPRSGGSDGKWSVTRPSNSVYHHIVITMDWSSNSNNPSFYIDGIRQTITVRNAPTLTPASDNGVLQIGNNSVNFNQGWGDSVVYTRLWNRLLTANEAWSLYTNPWQIYLKPNLNLAYWLVAPAQAAVIASVVNPTLLFMGVG